jgi:hypothetical protein
VTQTFTQTHTDEYASLIPTHTLKPTNHFIRVGPSLPPSYIARHHCDTDPCPPPVVVSSPSGRRSLAHGCRSPHHDCGLLVHTEHICLDPSLALLVEPLVKTWPHVHLIFLFLSRPLPTGGGLGKAGGTPPECVELWTPPPRHPRLRSTTVLCRYTKISRGTYLRARLVLSLALLASMPFIYSICPPCLSRF